MTLSSNDAPERDVETDVAGDVAGDDQAEHPLRYGHARMPLWRWLVWLAFAAFAAWYVVKYLVPSVGSEPGG